MHLCLENRKSLYKLKARLEREIHTLQTLDKHEKNGRIYLIAKYDKVRDRSIDLLVSSYTHLVNIFKIKNKILK